MATRHFQNRIVFHSQCRMINSLHCYDLCVGKDLVAGPAGRLKEAGVVLFCIGVEPDSLMPDEIETMKDEMRLIASEPTKHHLFISDGYRELERKVEGISRAACVGENILMNICVRYLFMSPREGIGRHLC